MTYHDKISAYIDNELSHEAEQDFLISLASNDGVRRAFRSELVMKNVIHQDEIVTQPKRELRGVLLGTLGIGTTAAVTQEATASGIVHSLFATKVGALLLAGVVAVSAGVGYFTHTLVGPNAPTVITRTVIQPAEAPQSTSTGAPTISAQPAAEQPVAERKSRSAKRHVTKSVETNSSEPTSTSVVGNSSITYDVK